MNCATCDSRTISWAPFLISLSSSGNRYDSVSRESSVHSMMSMNCFLMKSKIAIGSPSRQPTESSATPERLRAFSGLGRAGELFRFDFRVRELLFDLSDGQRAGNDRAVGKDQRGCRVDLQRFTERLRLRDGVAAVARVVGHFAGGEKVVPRLDLVRRAPDLLRFARRIRMQLIDRKQERVNRDVVQVLELILEPVAERTIGVGEDDELARAIAFDARERQIERQLVECDAVDLANLGFRQILLRRNVVNRADQ